MKTAGVTRVVFDFLKYGTDQKFIYLNKMSSNRKTIKVSYKLKSILLFKKCVTTSTDSGFTAVIGYSQYLIMPKHLSKELVL